MDIAYDHIQEEVLSPDEVVEKDASKNEKGNLNTELREAYTSFSASPWGARLGGFLGSVKKQGESYYEGARQEASAASEEALKGFTGLKSTIINRTRSLSLNQTPESSNRAPEAPTDSTPERSTKEHSDNEALRESESLVSRFKAEAAKRLKDIEKAEDAADEALLKFGTNIRNFLRDAVSIAPPTEDKDDNGNSKVLFESKDAEGKRVIHSTRFDAQLHAIHSSLDSFTRDPVSQEYEKWKDSFNVDERTERISEDLDKYEELRRAMENLVPEKVEYGEFWKRYYFPRMVVETEEQRRRDLLKGKAPVFTTQSHACKEPLANGSGAANRDAEEEQIAWDEDSDDETTQSTPNPSTSGTKAPATVQEATTTTISNHSPAQPTTSAISSTASDPKPTESLKPAEPRRSNEISQPDSDASYDLLSGATTGAPGSPKDDKEKEKGKEVQKQDIVAEESDEEDWE